MTPVVKIKIEFTMIQTVNRNKNMFTKSELKLADEAIKFYQNIGRPGYKTFFDMLQKGQIRNCNINMQDAKNTYKIYGPDEGALSGKTVQTKPSKIVTESLYQLPKDVSEKYKLITLAMDVFFFEGIAFFLTISRDIKFFAVEKIDNRENKTILECIKKSNINI